MLSIIMMKTGTAHEYCYCYTRMARIVLILFGKRRFCYKFPDKTYTARTI